MKLIYVTSMLPFGPNEAFFIPEVRELRAKGCDVVVVPMWPRGPVVHSDANELLPLVNARPPWSLAVMGAAAGEALTQPRAVLRVARVMARSRSLKVFAKNAAIFAKGLWLARIARAERADHIHAQWASASATMAYVASELSGVSWSFTAHRWDIAENNLIAEKAASATFVRAIDVAGGDEIAVHMKESARKLRVIHMGVPNSVVAVREVARCDGPLRIVVAANLVEKKGHVFALDAVLAVKKRGITVAVDFAGGGPLEGELRARAKALGLESEVHFLGVVPHDRLLGGLREGRWDVALLPSIVTGDGEREGIPVFLIEAMACGVPVVSTATGGIPELLAKGGGILVPQRDVPALASAIETLARTPSLREELGSQGVSRVRADFTVESSITEILECMTGGGR
jgi:colanic acid/amylovoran biosynthesis glycosyltransferase